MQSLAFGEQQRRFQRHFVCWMISKIQCTTHVTIIMQNELGVSECPKFWHKTKKKSVNLQKWQWGTEWTEWKRTLFQKANQMNWCPQKHNVLAPFLHSRVQTLNRLQSSLYLFKCKNRWPLTSSECARTFPVTFESLKSMICVIWRNIWWAQPCSDIVWVQTSKCVQFCCSRSKCNIFGSYFGCTYVNGDFLDRFVHQFVRKYDRGHEMQSQRQCQNSRAPKFQTKQQLPNSWVRCKRPEMQKIHSTSLSW